MLKAHSLDFTSFESAIKQMDATTERLEKEQRRRNNRSITHIDFASLSLEWKVAQFPVYCYGIYGFTLEDSGQGQVELNEDASYWTFSLVTNQPFKLTDSMLALPTLLTFVKQNRLVLTPILLQRLVELASEDDPPAESRMRRLIVGPRIWPGTGVIRLEAGVLTQTPTTLEERLPAGLEDLSMELNVEHVIRHYIRVLAR